MSYTIFTINEISFSCNEWIIWVNDTADDVNTTSFTIGGVRMLLLRGGVEGVGDRTGDSNVAS